MHPGAFVDVVAEWRSPITGLVTAGGTLTHAQAGGNGIEWWVARDSKVGREILGHGTIGGTGSHGIADSARETKLQTIRVEAGVDVVLTREPPESKILILSTPGATTQAATTK